MWCGIMNRFNFLKYSYIYKCISYRAIESHSFAHGLQFVLLIIRHSCERLIFQFFSLTKIENNNNNSNNIVYVCIYKWSLFEVFIRMVVQRYVWHVCRADICGVVCTQRTRFVG